MPELPEVEVVRRGLAEHVVGRTVARASFFGSRVTRRHLPGPADLSARLAGARVAAARRRGKYLWLVLDHERLDSAVVDGADVAATASDRVGGALLSDGQGRGGDVGRDALIVHLGMSGQMLVEAPAAPREKHLHATFDFEPVDGVTGTQLRFVDQRTFGGVALAGLVPDPADPLAAVPEPVSHIAPDLLEPAFDQVSVVRAMKQRRSAVKRALLDQSLMSGIGNIYADEGLWRAGIHGERPCDTLTKPAMSRLLDHVRDVMGDALAVGGTSFDALYVDVNGASGYFDRSLAAYGQAGRPCRRCGTPMRRESFMNRSSFSCPRCQPRPRAAG